MDAKKREREKGQSNERRDNTEGGGGWMDGEGWRVGGMDRWVSLNSNPRA